MRKRALNTSPDWFIWDEANIFSFDHDYRHERCSCRVCISSKYGESAPIGPSHDCDCKLGEYGMSIAQIHLKYLYIINTEAMVN